MTTHTSHSKYNISSSTILWRTTVLKCLTLKH